MIDTIVKVICAILCSFTTVYITKKILGKNFVEHGLKDIILILLIAAITYFSYGIQYNVDSALFRIVLCIFIFRIFINKTMYQTIITTLISMSIILASDLITSLFFINFVTPQQIRGENIWILICNSCVCIFALIIINIPLIKSKLIKFVNNLNAREKLSTIFVFVLSVIIIMYTLYNISRNYSWNEKYIINFIVAITYIIIIMIFLRDRLQYNNLMNQYDNLFNYFKDFENSLDEKSLTNHEYKNQLAVINGYLEANKIKEAKKSINEILNGLSEGDETIISELSNIPKGGVKGLLYYKVITAKNKNVEIILDTSDNLSSSLDKLSREKNKIISKVLGVYIDNAIDAALCTDNKTVTIETYFLNNKINFVISNKFDNKALKIENIGKKGYTTKKSGHGNGLYLINKITEKINWFTIERKIINDFYIQKIIIDINKCSY